MRELMLTSEVNRRVAAAARTAAEEHRANVEHRWTTGEKLLGTLLVISQLVGTVLALVHA